MSDNTDDTEKLYKILKDGKSRSLLKKHLTTDIYESLKDKRSSWGGTFGDCIRSGALNESRFCGLFACDPDAYTVFHEIFDLIIKDYHKLDIIKHPGCNFGNLEDLGFDNLDPDGKFIVSTRVRIGRSIKGYPFPPLLTLQHREEIEDKTIKALQQLPQELRGSYHSFESTSDAEIQKLSQEHYLYNLNNKRLADVGVYNDWPKKRGIYYNSDKSFLVWINEEDHIRIISMQKGGDLASVYRRLVTAVRHLEDEGDMEFARLPGHGFLTFCPTNLGTTLRASVHIRIPKMHAKNNKGADYVINFCNKYHLQARGSKGDPAEPGDSEIYDLSNKHRLGLTEFEALTEMRKGIQEVIKYEMSL